ncbi:MAG: hypothetical protein HY746_02155 [Elusimicrobia bacterium]|nr:hypothetical protein [Elusimicrobiota bacterium]
MKLKASEPFKFRTRLTLVQATGRKAGNIMELLEGIRESDDSIIYHHTHRFLKQFHFLVPEPANDFAYWVNNILQEEKLGEELASVEIVRFNSLEAIKRAFVEILERHLKQVSEPMRAVSSGKEFHFLRSIRFSIPTSHQARDYAEFIECLRNVSVSTLYLHVFEARLRPPYGVDDFSNWFLKQFNDAEIQKAISRLDPYSYTLEGLRRRIIRILEQRIQEMKNA